jgi:hypothetical protein
MTRSILNTLSTGEIIAFGVGGMVVLAVLAAALARRLFPNLAASEFESVADSLRVVYELIFALILAFVIAAVLDEMGTAEATVAAEATTIAELVRTNEALPERDKQRLDAAVGQYVHAVAGNEWKTMRDGEASPQAAAALEGLYAEYREVRPVGNAQTEHYRQALSDLHGLEAKRRERLDLASADLPTMLRVLVVVGLFVLLVLEYRPQLAPAAGLVFMGALAMVVTAAFLLTVILNYPFAGDVAVSNQAFKQDTLAQFWSAELAYRRRPGDEDKPLTAQQLQGVWNSDAYGTIVMRCQDPAARTRTRACGPGDTRMRGVYRYNTGTVTGRVTNGVFEGWWSEEPGRRPDSYAGRFEWQRLATATGDVILGTWGYGLREPRKPGWDLARVGGPEPPDLRVRFAATSAFRQTPRPRRP